MIPVAQDAADLVPHRPPMRWVERLVECSERCAVSVSRLPVSHPGLDQFGRLRPEVLIELAAQTFAAMRGHQAHAAGAHVPKGLLVSVPRADILALPRAGETVRVELSAQPAFDSFRPAHAVVLVDGRQCAEISMTIWEVPDDEEDD